MNTRLYLYPYRYFPYELVLARREVEALAGPEVVVFDDRFEVPAGRLSSDAAARLTYFCEIVYGDGESVVPLQARLESSARRNGDDSTPRRQTTRYSAHGIHEYKGKFNPQVARAIANVGSLGPCSRVWDPFCGSGTVLLEALHDGRSAVGTDPNPLSVLISNAKIAALRAEPGELDTTAAQFIDELSRRAGEIATGEMGEAALKKRLGVRWAERVPNADYLSGWIPLRVQAQLLVALELVQFAVPTHLQGLFRVLVSDTVREVSWQDPSDLRIRRRKDAAPNYPAVERISDHVRAQVGRIRLARGQLGAVTGTQAAVEADSRDLAAIPAAARDFLTEGVDAVVTSPPYASALPYIDTQRLSLALLGLAEASRIRWLEREILGSRELSQRARHQLVEQIQMGASALPHRTAALVRSLLHSLDFQNDGFRRHNTPAVIYRYFVGMRAVFAAVSQVLRPGGRAFFIVGPSRTVLGGSSISIDTPELLAEVGESTGLVFDELIELQTYPRYSLHQSNSIREEKLLILRQR